MLHLCPKVSFTDFCLSRALLLILVNFFKLLLFLNVLICSCSFVSFILGILKFCTLGFFMIFQLVDVILIATQVSPHVMILSNKCYNFTPICLLLLTLIIASFLNSKSMCSLV